MQIDLKIVDFGIFGTNRGNAGEKSNAGSLKYMSPEVLIGFTESTPKIDVWSLGIILYGLVIGVLPFRSSNKEELRKIIIEKEISISRKEMGLTKECADLIMKMLDKDPATRISMREIFEHPWIARYKREKQYRGSILVRAISNEDEFSEEDKETSPSQSNHHTSGNF